MINVPPTPDHAEVDLGTAAGVTDRGLRHQRNEDAMALESEQTPDGLVVVAVVCDGVSSSARPDEASRAAAQAALPVLLEAVQSGGDLAEASRAAVVAGRRSVAGLGELEGERSATTFLSVVAARDDMTVCWLGDSRAYWLAATVSESAQLTRDDSVAGGMVEAGLATEETAMALPHAHVLTRWLGAEAADLNGDPARAPHVEQYAPPGAGVVLGAANDMVRFAVEAGGADNITAVLIPYPAPAPA
jgi:serine/threonine protein phosphatase PrpC